ncbi:hypothetical protein [Candidatus Nanohalococcus occultus]|uniref:hypothetical protein n=1 Tax=Candidatus Nanohalococcus occultus TaxID=2978047 RepID=UPI0039E0B365
MNKLDHFWAKSLGCTEQDLNFKESKIVVRTEETDYNRDRSKTEIDIFEHQDSRIVSCSSALEEKLRKHKNTILNEDITLSNLENTGLEIKELLGPAFLSHTTEEKFRNTKAPNCRQLTQKDSKKLEQLKQRSDEEEIENSIGDAKIQNCPVFGKFIDKELVAVSSYQVWDQTIGFPDVFVKEEFRGNSYGKQVVSKSTEHILENDLIPVYRTLEKWHSSVGLAKVLGYTKYATTYLLKLEE